MSSNVEDNLDKIVKAMTILQDSIESINYELTSLNKSFAEYFDAFVKTTNEYTYPNFR